MTNLFISIGVFVVVLLGRTLWHVHYAKVDAAYIDGFRDGQMAEAQANYASRPTIVKVPLMGVN